MIDAFGQVFPCMKEANNAAIWQAYFNCAWGPSSSGSSVQQHGAELFFKRWIASIINHSIQVSRPRPTIFGGTVFHFSCRGVDLLDPPE